MMAGAAYPSVLAAMRTIAAEEGWRSLYRGLGVSCIKQAPQTGARLRLCTHSGTQRLSIGGIWFWGMCTASSCRPSLLSSCTAARTLSLIRKLFCFQASRCGRTTAPRTS